MVDGREQNEIDGNFNGSAERLPHNFTCKEQKLIDCLVGPDTTFSTWLYHHLVTDLEN